jgi:quercetin dioxygenase-like cupin family protein
MALPHAQLLDVVSVRPLGEALRGTPSTSLLKTDRLQLLHMVLRDHQDVPLHHVDDECTLHCLEGSIEVDMPGGTRRLNAGDIVVLPAHQPHALRARSDAALLVTLLLNKGDAGDGTADRRAARP